MPDDDGRCEYSDLLIAHCACHHCKPEAETENSVEVAYWFTARFNSKCSCCGEDMLEGARIGRDVDGDLVCGTCGS